MKIHLAKHAGFCFGVRRAMEIVNNLIGEENVHTLGPLIHNPQVVKDLEQKGIKYIETLEEIPAGKVIIRAHGVPPQEIQKAKQLGLEVIDATCPYVKKVHDTTKKLHKENYQVIIFGEENHAEVIGIKGNSETAIIIESSEEARKLGYYEKLGLVSQTTQSKEKFEKTAKELEKHASKLKVYNTICDATAKRQEAAAELAKKVELMIVLGGYNSGNTKRLVELCSKETETVHIEKFSDLEIKILERKKEIGLTAGASTPDYLIKELINKIESYRVG